MARTTSIWLTDLPVSFSVVEMTLQSVNFSEKQQITSTTNDYYFGVFNNAVDDAFYNVRIEVDGVFFKQTFLVNNAVECGWEGYWSQLAEPPEVWRIDQNSEVWPTNSFGENLDAKVSEAGGGTGTTPQAVWEYAQRTLTAATNITSDGSAILVTGGQVDQIGAIADAGIKASSYAAGAITSTAIAAAALNGKGDWNTVTPDNTQGSSVITHGDGIGAWGAVADTTLLAKETTAQTILTTGGPGPWTTGTAANAESRIELLTPSRWERPPSGTTTFTVQLTVLDATGTPVNADSTPTITAEDFGGGSLDANWAGAVTNPATGSYKRVYNVPSTHPETDVLFKAQAAIAAAQRMDSSVTTVSDPLPDISALALEDTSQSILTLTGSVDTKADTIITTGGAGPWTQGNTIAPDNTQAQTVIDHGGAGPWTQGNTIAPDNTQAQQVIQYGGAGPWTTGTPGGSIGPGSIVVTITVKDTGGNPLDTVDCWVSTDQAGNNVIAGTLQTNVNGIVQFLLDESTYWLWLQKSGYSFEFPTQIAVSSTGMVSFVGNPVPSPVPP